jgi:mannose-6-phosphate isomerase-like protein (cupin superfamily)
MATFDRPKRVEKPWGYELWWAQTDRYVGKLLHVNAGHRLSLQYHVRKDETIHLWSGRLTLVLDEDGGGLREHQLEPGQSYHVKPGTRHRMIAITDCDILEASTPEVEDVVRLEDAYGRSS